MHTFHSTGGLDDIPSPSAQSTGIRHAKPNTLRCGPSMKLGQMSDSQPYVLHLYWDNPAKNREPEDQWESIPDTSRKFTINGKFEGKVDEGFLVGYSNYDGDAAFDGKENDFDAKKPASEVILSPSRYRDLSAEFEDCSDNTSNEVNAASTIVPTVGQNSLKSTNTFSDVELEDIIYSDDDNDVGAEADFNNLGISITVSHIPTTRVHKDHLVSQIIGDMSSTTQTRSMTRVVKDQASTPIDLEKPLLKDPDGEDVDVHTYKSMIGSLMYLTSSRPDIMFATNNGPRNVDKSDPHGNLPYRSLKITRVRTRAWSKSGKVGISRTKTTKIPMDRYEYMIIGFQKAERNVESIHLEIETHNIFQRCKAKGASCVSVEFCRFKKYELSFLYVHEGYGHKDYNSVNWCPRTCTRLSPIVLSRCQEWPRSYNLVVLDGPGHKSLNVDGDRNEYDVHC
uniref:Uncharacterized protein n=1 Tax=Tanacetum cinerariifolium TaxID=118510 RepID=A0A6L2JV39_TANCI|nr:hypothetical protein [Tanacetum cinerariifolium]